MAFRRNRFRRRKRWYFSAGAKLPFIGKTNVSFGSGTKARKSKRAMYSIAKKVVRSTVEPKRFIYAINEVTNWTQNTIYTHNIMQLIAKGTDDDNRIGERIHLKNLLIDYQLHGVYQGNAVYDGYFKQVRFLVIRARQEHTGTDWISGFGSSDIFEQNHVNHFMKGPLLKENITVLYDKLITFEKPSKTDYNVSVKQGVINIPLNCTFQYNDISTSITGKWWNLYLVAIPHIPGGSTAQTMSMESNIGYHLNFSDTK